MIKFSLCGCLAQLVERRPYKANVGGSIPSAPTRRKLRYLFRATGPERGPGALVER